MTDRAIATQAEDVFTSVLKGAEAPEADKLLELFSQLEPVSVDSMIGLWRVAAFGRSPRDPIAVPPDPGPLPQREGLGMRKLYGKRFLSRDDAEPIVCQAEDGSLVASVDFGVARLRELSFRGTSSAGMVYDTQPWIDYFRKLEDDTLVAMIDMKGTPMGIGFFMLRG
jgi:Domain of unknown function (DUF4334)